MEFALIRPLLLVLLLMAIDFGRVFFGWVALHNASRIGAEYASSHSGAWLTPGIAFQRDQYTQLVLNDLQALNCNLPTPPVPDPQFIDDADGDGTFTSDGDLVRVDLNCSFGLLTPFAEAIFGGPVPVSVRSDFAIHHTLVGQLPDPSGPPPGLCSVPDADFTTVPAPGSGNRIAITSGQSVTFSDTSTASSGCEITSWAWDWETNGVPDDTTPGPVTHAFTYGGSGPFTTYMVTLTVTNSGGPATHNITVRVSP